MQVNAVLFLHLVILLQLSIVLARNPSFWWRFARTSAPSPSLWLLVPIALFSVGATFVAAYWPIDVQPDGGRGELQGAGASCARPTAAPPGTAAQACWACAVLDARLAWHASLGDGAAECCPTPACAGLQGGHAVQTDCCAPAAASALPRCPG